MRDTRNVQKRANLRLYLNHNSALEEREAASGTVRRKVPLNLIQP